VEDGRPDLARLGRWRHQPIQVGAVGRQGTAEEAEAHQEDRLEVTDCLTLDPGVHIVEPAVGEVVLDPGPADPADPPVDDKHLAMVQVGELVEAPVDRSWAADWPVAVERQRVVPHDLDAVRGQVVE
jgi:hypothetical protein